MGRHTILNWTGLSFNWNDRDVVVVASGPSAAATDFGFVRGRAQVLAVSLSWRLVPWADALFSSDQFWWVANNGCPDFAGRKFTSSPYAAKRYGLDVVWTTGNNSGLRAIHLAKVLGARRVLLIGFDMHARDGLHWHEPHPKGLFNPSKAGMRLWCDEVHAAAKRLSGVINCTPGSALQCFPTMSLEEAFNGVNRIQSGTDQSRHCAVS
jgi:hypothetical protein